MIQQVKRVMFRFFVLAFAIWPTVHFVAATQLEFDPWKFGGFGMYTVPSFGPSVMFYGTENGIPFLILPYEFSKEATRKIGRYVVKGKSYGPRYAPDEVARQLLDDFPQFDSIRVEVRRLELDPQNDRLRTRLDEFDYPRDPPRP